MSVEPILEVIEQEQSQDGASDPLARSRAWPATKLVSGTLSLSLVAVLSIPLLAAPTVTAGVISAPSVLLGALIARWTFDSRSVRVGGRLSWRVGLAATASTAIALGTVCAAALVVGAALGVALVLASLVLTALVLVIAAAMRAVEVRYLRSSRRVFLVASEEQRRDIAREIRRHEGMDLVGFSNVLASGADAGPVRRHRLAAQLTGNRATMMVLSMEAARSEDVVAAASDFNLAGGRVRDLGDFYERHFHKVPLSELTASWFLFDVAGIHRARVYGVCKRAAEVGLSGVGLLLAMPLMLAIAISVKLSGPGPVFFRQERVGRNRQAFTLLKFRTMEASDDDSPAWAGEHAHRVTGVGRFLRRYRLDELPQLWTVLRGDMSLVGPRPEQVALVDQLRSQIEYYDARHVVRPGLTGWAQVNHGYGGSHGGTLEKLQYDLFYIKNQRFRMDALVVARTLRAIVHGHAD
jgi:exopolysaccharide biosynthesis polyprenyl glycosylphosphotransferase